VATAKRLAARRIWPGLGREGVGLAWLVRARDGRVVARSWNPASARVQKRVVVTYRPSSWVPSGNGFADKVIRPLALVCSVAGYLAWIAAQERAMNAMPRSLPLLIGCALLAATSSAVRPTTANAMTLVPTGAVG
jgi:hypothetical protein